MFEHEGSAHTRYVSCSRSRRRTETKQQFRLSEVPSEMPSEMLAEKAEKARELRRRRMAVVGPYVMPEARRCQG